jgi:hypothetical protein
MKPMPFMNGEEQKNWAFQGDADHPWAQRFKGIFVWLVVDDYYSAKNLFQRAAD